MRTRGALASIVCCLMLFTVACRQPEGEMPTPTGEQGNKVGDISRDLQHLAEERPEALSELSDDLAELASPAEAPSPELLLPLSDGLAAALRQQSLSDAEATHLANLLFSTLVARDLHPSQIERLESDVNSALVAIGAEPAAARQTAEAASAIQREMTENRKRWYHLF